MQTALVLGLALLLGLIGGWGAFRVLGRLVLDPAERLALTVALFPALLAEAAFVGLLTGRPGPMLPVATCVVLGALGLVVTRKPHPPTPSPLRWRGGAGMDGGTSDEARPGEARSGGASPAPTSTAGSVGAGLAPPATGEIASVAVGVGLFAAGALGTTLLMPLSAGALRIGDWVAHWFLVVVYLGEPLPDLRTFINRVGDFGVISRPPLYNLEGGLLVGALDTQFWPFQFVTPLLALSVAGAGVLWGRAIGGARAAWVLAGLVGLSPFLLQNASYPWSKMVAAGLVLLFLLMIRAAVLARDPLRARQTFVLAALCAGLGYLAHQTTIFYVLPTIAWLLWRRPHPLFRRPIVWTLVTWALAGVAGIAAFAPWQVWVLATYGLRATLESNPAWFGADVTDTLGDWLLKGEVAIVGTLVPLPALGAIARGTWPSVDQVLRAQLALLTGALGASGCWLLVARGGRRVGGAEASVGRAGLTAGGASPAPTRVAWGKRLVRRPPWLALVALSGFLGQVMLQPNWHDTGDAAESMTPIVILGLAYVARAATRLDLSRRRLFVGLVLAELAFYLGLWLWWAFSPAWTRDPNTVLASRYGLDHLRAVWRPAVAVGAVLLATGLSGSVVVMWRSLGLRGQPVARR